VILCQSQNRIDLTQTFIPKSKVRSCKGGRPLVKELRTRRDKELRHCRCYEREN
jgi:hypothetical protein